MEFKNIEFSVKDRIALIAINRPDFGNAMNHSLASELAAAALICDNDATIKVVLLSGNGRMFCAGGDLKAFAAFGDDAGQRVKEMADELHKAISLFARMNAVVVVAVNGTAAGAGFSLAITGDIVLAAESAKFTMAYTAAGLSPDGSSTYYLPRLIGLRRAQELMLTNRVLSAVEALEWGLITRVTADETLAEEAERLTEQLAVGPAGSHAAVKRLLLVSSRNGLEEQMEIEGRSIAASAISSDGIEGVRAFTEKRRPAFL